MRFPLLTDVRGRRSSVSAELRGAVATFLTMAYILPTNANILAAGGMASYKGSIVACTALAAGICCILMGLFANFPLALASGMGLNAMVVFTLAAKAGSWQAAMGMVVLDGLIVLLLVLAGLREAVMNAIPRDLRLAIGAGIGLFIALIGLSNAGIVLQGVPAPPAGPLLRVGDLHAKPTMVALAGLLLTAVLMAWRFKGALVVGIIASTALAIFWKVTTWQGGHLWQTPSFAVAFHADVRGALRWELMPLLFAVIMVDFFDTLGTATAIAEEGELQEPSGAIPGVRRLLIVDSISASIGGMLGVSSVTSYIESAAGVAEGARTGLHSVFVGLLFLLAIFLAPLAEVVPASATAAALILVGFLMMKQAAAIDFEHVGSAIPAFITLLTIPATYSIADGVGLGFVAYVVIQVLTGKPHRVHPVLYATAAAFAAYFIWAPGR
jgi:AGZA family xanthine/uracil permease-like MFS transporter